MVIYTLLALVVLYLAWEAITWPRVAALAKEPPETTAFIERYRRGPWLGLGPNRKVEWKWVSYSRISFEPQAGGPGQRGHPVLRP